MIQRDALSCTGQKKHSTWGDRRGTRLVRGPCPSPSPCLQEPFSGPLRALEAEMRAQVDQPAAPSEVRCDRARATFAQPSACLRYVPHVGTPDGLCPAEGTWRLLTLSCSLTGKQSLGTRSFSEMSESVSGASSSRVLLDRPCSQDTFV